MRREAQISKVRSEAGGICIVLQKDRERMERTKEERRVLHDKHSQY
jgi:hypothetical protein